MGLLIDVFACAESGIAPTLGALELTKAYKEEDEYIVLDSLTTQLSKIETVWYDDQKTSKALSKLVVSVLKDKVDALGFDYKDDDSYRTVQLRTLVISELAHNGYPFIVIH